MTRFCLREKKDLFFLILVGSFALIIRLYRLDNVPPALYYDEILSTYQPFLMTRSSLSIGQLPSLLVSIVTGTFPIYSLFGPSTFFTRLPAAIYGSVLVVPVYLLSKRLLGKDVARLSALIVTVVPWGFHFSRYGIISISYVFYVTLYIYFLVSYYQTRKPIFKHMFGIALAASFYTHAMAIPFAFIFLSIIIPLLHQFRKIGLRDLVVLGLYVFIGTAPYLVYLFFPQYISPHTGLSTFSAAGSPLELVGAWVDSALIHLSPDFLVFTGGKALALNATEGFHHRIISDALYYYSDGGKTGMLNLYGVLVYFGLVLVIYRIIKRRACLSEIILASWILAYALTSGVAYYDNPHSARNIEGLPAFVILVALSLTAFTRRMQEKIRGKLVTHKQFLSAFAVFLAFAVVVAPSMQYFWVYFNEYQGVSAPYFDYEYRELSDYLVVHNLWDSEIYIYDAEKWYSSVILSFYNDSAKGHIFRVIGGPSWSGKLQERSTSSVFVTRSFSQLSELERLGIPVEYESSFYYPDGKLALVLAKIFQPSVRQLLLKEVKYNWTHIETGVDIFGNWVVGKTALFGPNYGKDIEYTRKLEGGVFSVDLSNLESVGRYWYMYKFFDPPLNLTENNLLQIEWEARGNSTVSLFFRVGDGFLRWTGPRVVYPNKAMNLRQLTEYNSSILSGLVVIVDLPPKAEETLNITKLGFYQIVDHPSTSISVNLPGNDMFAVLRLDEDNSSLILQRGAMSIKTSVLVETYPQDRYLILNFTNLSPRGKFLNVSAIVHDEFNAVKFSESFEMIEWNLHHYQLVMIPMRLRGPELWIDLKISSEYGIALHNISIGTRS